MKKLLSILICSLCFASAIAQPKKAATATRENDNLLPEIHSNIIAVQGQMPLFTANYGNNSKEHDANSIIMDIEKYIDSLHGFKTRGDFLLNKYFAPLRLYYLTVTNKTTVATSFLYDSTPYTFCRYDSGLTLHIAAIKDGDIYNLGKMTEKRAAMTALETCLLPSLKAFDEFKEGEIKYVALSIYYGCKDNREGAAAEPVTPYCMTLLAKLDDVQQYNAGLITVKGLRANAAVYLSDRDTMKELEILP